jgi:hypothetical protein
MRIGKAEMDKSLSQIVDRTLNRRVTWTDRKGRAASGFLQEIHTDIVIVRMEPYGSGVPRRVRLKPSEVKFADDGGFRPQEHVTYSLQREPGHLWRWEIRIDGESWRKRRGFGSHRTANESLRLNMAEAHNVARNLHPPVAAVCARNIWRAEYVRSRLGPADFFDRLSAQRKKQCNDMVDELERLGMSAGCDWR